MYIRRDVDNLARKLSAASGLDCSAVYAFLMDTGKSKGVNPCRLEFVTGNGVIFPKGERDSYSLEVYRQPERVRSAEEEARANYWEERILERQEKYMD